MTSHRPDDPSCEGCELATRRDFLRASALGAAALAALGLGASSAAALPVRLLDRGAARRGDTVAYAIPAADGVTIDKDNEVILVRWQGKVYAFALSCPHQNTALRWVQEDGRFQCPKHKSRYQPDGTFISGRATRSMDRFDVKREGGKVVVNLTALHEQDKEQGAWTAAAITL